MAYADPGAPECGLCFDGRSCKDSKLSTGVWGRAAQLRIHPLEWLASLALDLVITGAERDEIGVLASAKDTALSTVRLIGVLGASALSARRPQIKLIRLPFADPCKTFRRLVVFCLWSLRQSCFINWYDEFTRSEASKCLIESRPTI